MKSKISIISLGVKNLKASHHFYKTLGFELAVEENTDSIVFFKLVNEAMLLGIYPWDKLAEDAEVDSTGSGFRGVTIAHNVESPELVDTVLAEAVAAGGRLVKPGKKVFWGGYSGYFADPDGHLWEVAHNPFMDLS